MVVASYLHSNMDRLKPWRMKGFILLNFNLHSNMDRLKPTTQGETIEWQTPFTFQYG